MSCCCCDPLTCGLHSQQASNLWRSPACSDSASLLQGHIAILLCIVNQAKTPDLFATKHQRRACLYEVLVAGMTTSIWFWKPTLPCRHSFQDFLQAARLWHYLRHSYIAGIPLVPANSTSGCCPAWRGAISFTCVRPNCSSPYTNSNIGSAEGDWLHVEDATQQLLSLHTS